MVFTSLYDLAVEDEEEEDDDDDEDEQEGIDKCEQTVEEQDIILFLINQN